MICHDLGGGEIRSARIGRAIVDETITACCATDSVRIFLLRAVAGDNSIVRDTLVDGDICVVNELESVVACRNIRGESLSEATELICIGFVPKMAVGAVTEIAIFGKFTRLRVDSFEAKMGRTVGFKLEVHIPISDRGGDLRW